MILYFLFLFKFIIFSGIINIHYNRPILVLFSLGISSLVLSVIYYVSNNDKRYKNGLIFYSLVSLIMAIDSMYYRHFNTLPNILAIKQVGQLTAVGDSLKFLLNYKVVLLLLDIPLLLYLYKKDKIKNFRYGLKRWKKITGFNFILLLLLLVLLIVREELPSLRSQEFYTYHVLDIYDTISGKKKTSNAYEELGSKEIEKYKNRLRLKKNAKYQGIAKGKNLIVLQIEGLQDFPLGLEYNGQEITPNLNKLIETKGSLYFSDYFQLLGRGNTSDAEFVTNNSLHPSMEEPTYSQFEKNKFYGLPWILKEYGYESYVFHGYERNFWNRDKAYKNQGFKKYFAEDDYSYDKDDIIAFGIKDEDFYNQTIDYLVDISKEDRPFYAFIISLSSHTPFTMPEKYKKLKIKDEHDNMIGDYLQSVHYADKAIGMFIQRLKEEDLYDNSVIAIYGDHFGISAAQEEAGKMDTIIGREYDYDDMMHIPLIIHVSGEDINEEIKEVGSQIDFLPTILNIFGYESDKALGFGRDLLNTKDNFVAPQTYMLKGSFITDKYLFEFSRNGVFNHSRLIDRSSRRKLKVDKAKKIYDKAIEEINSSNYILMENYFSKQFSCN